VTVTLMGYVPGPRSVPAVGLCATVKDPDGVQLSLAKIATGGTDAVQPAPTWAAAGGVKPTVGSVLSMTVTVWVAVAVLPCPSFAVYVIVVVPTGKTFTAGMPLGVTVTLPPQLSLADGVLRFETTTEQLVAPGPVEALMLAGAVIVGGVLSMTVIVWVAVAVLPCPSLAV